MAARPNKDSLEGLSQWLKSEIAGKPADGIKAFVIENADAVLRWRLLAKISGGRQDRVAGALSWLSKLGSKAAEKSEEVQSWLFLPAHREALKLFLSSGEAEGGDWKGALELLSTIVEVDPGACSGVRLRLAVAVALAFAAPTRAFKVFGSLGPVDAIDRYFAFATWWDSSELYATFGDLTAWQLRYVVGSWAQNDELAWVRQNLGASCSRATAGEAATRMIAYRERNAQGVSVQDENAYYGGRPITPQLLKEVGAVCGGISKFSTAVCQAFGVPAMPVGQPGHCAFAWQARPGLWMLGNSCAGWTESNRHEGAHLPWGKEAWFVALMEHAQQDVESYAVSESLREVAELAGDGESGVAALTAAKASCPFNFGVWQDLLARAKPGGQSCSGGDLKAWTGQQLKREAAAELRACPQAVHHLYAALKKKQPPTEDGECFVVEAREWEYLEQLEAELVSAEWGQGEKWADVQGFVAVALASGAPLQARNDVLGCDPCPGMGKMLRVKYALDP